MADALDSEVCIGARVLVADAESAVRRRLQTELERLGCQVAATAEDGDGAWHVALRVKPDLAILDVDLPGADGFETAKAIRSALAIPILLIARFDDPELVARAVEAGSYGLIPKSCPLVVLGAAIAIAMERHRERKQLQAEVNVLRDRLETRKLVSRAKAILMETHGLSEQEAFRRIQAQSMARARPLKEIAEAVILSARTIRDRPPPRSPR